MKKKYKPNFTENQIKTLDLEGVYAPIFRDKERNIGIEKLPGFFKAKDKKIVELKIRDIEEMMKSFDLKVVYQRGSVWDRPMQQGLFSSIMNENPVGCLHLVKYKNYKISGKYYVLDGLQRLSTIIGFLGNEFPVFLSIDGETYEMFWDEILKCEDPRVSNNYVRKIRQYDLVICCIWEYMNIQDQADLFELVNRVVDLKPDERIYCPRFHTKKTMEYIIEKGYKELAQNISNASDRLNLRQKSCRTIHEALILCFGEDLSGSFNIVHLNANLVKISSQKIHNMFILNEFGSEEKIDKDALKKIGIDKQIEQFLKTIKTTDDILRFKNPHITKKCKKNEVLDIVLFLFSKVKYEKTETFASIQNNIETFYNIFVNYLEKRKTLTYKYKKKNNNVTEHTTSVECIKARLECLNEIYNQMIVDNGIKNKSPNIEQKNKVRFNADTCKCGRKLTDKNLHIDHIVSTKISSEEEYQALCYKCNLRKSGALKKDTI